MRPFVRHLCIIASLTCLLYLLIQQNLHPNQQQQDKNSGGPQSFTVASELSNNERTSTSWFSALISNIIGDSSHEEDAKFLPVTQGYLNYRLIPADLTVDAAGQQSKDIQKIGDREWMPISPVVGNAVGDTVTATNKMTGESASNEEQQQQESAEIRGQIKCSENKFDRLIAQKIRINGLSRPIITSSGRFDNPFPTWSSASLAGLVQFMLEPSETNLPSNRDELEKELPLLKPTFDIENPSSFDFRATWIGHSTLLIQVDGFNIITDPIFSDRASFSQFIGPKRIREPACDIKSLPRIDIVLISHNHYDHLDSNSVKQLNDRFGKNCRWIVPLGLGEFLRSMYVKNYVELDWWQKDCFLAVPTTNWRENNNQEIISIHSTSSNKEISDKNSLDTKVNKNIISQTGRTSVQNDRSELDIYLTPSQHWTRRWIADTNKSLWGSFTIVNKNGAKFFFAGDTGYCSAFEEIGRIFGPFTGAAIPIGAYKPRWFLKAQHVDPKEAVQVHKDLKCKKSIAIHHSTFLLSNEDYREPKRLLREIMHDQRMNGNLTEEPFISLKHGESVEFCKAC